MQETGPTVYRPYPRRLEYLTILQMSLQRQHILLSYFKTLSVGPVWDSNPRPPARQSGALPTELTGRRYKDKKHANKWFGREVRHTVRFYLKFAASGCIFLIN